MPELWPRRHRKAKESMVSLYRYSTRILNRVLISAHRFSSTGTDVVITLVPPENVPQPANQIENLSQVWVEKVGVGGECLLCTHGRLIQT